MMATEREVAAAGERIERLLGEVRASATPNVSEIVEELVQRLTDLYGAGLERVIGALENEDEPVGVARERLIADPIVSSLLLLHGLHPDDPRARIESALERVRSLLAAQGADLELLELGPRKAAFRLVARSAQTPVEALVELADRAVRSAAPELDEVRIEAPVDASKLVQLHRKPSPTAESP
jgi:hypothetical protein